MHMSHRGAVDGISEDDKHQYVPLNSMFPRKWGYETGSRSFWSPVQTKDYADSEAKYSCTKGEAKLFCAG